MILASHSEAEGVLASIYMSAQVNRLVSVDIGEWCNEKKKIYRVGESVQIKGSTQQILILALESLYKVMTWVLRYI